MSMYTRVVLAYIITVMRLYDITEERFQTEKARGIRTEVQISLNLGYYLGKTVFKKHPTKLHTDQKNMIVSVTIAFANIRHLFDSLLLGIYQTVSILGIYLTVSCSFNIYSIQVKIRLFVCLLVICTFVFYAFSSFPPCILILLIDL